MTEAKGRSAVREIASCAVMTAFLLAVQLALSAVSGVELVTAIFLVFCYRSEERRVGKECRL